MPVTQAEELGEVPQRDVVAAGGAGPQSAKVAPKHREQVRRIGLALGRVESGPDPALLALDDGDDVLADKGEGRGAVDFGLPVEQPRHELRFVVLLGVLAARPGRGGDAVDGFEGVEGHLRISLARRPVMARSSQTRIAPGSSRPCRVRAVPSMTTFLV